MRTTRRSAAGLTLTVLAALAILLGIFVAVPGRTVIAEDEDLEEVVIILTDPLPLEDFLKAVGKVAILFQRTVHLVGQLLEIGSLCWRADHRMQSFRNCIQLLEAFQSTPVKWFAAFTVDCISHCCADLGLDRHQFRVSGLPVGYKRGGSSESCGTFGNPPSD